MAFSTERILMNNLNIGFNVMTCLSFKDRYNLCLTSKSLFETLFKKYQHNEIIRIKFKDYRLCDIWDNIKFRIDLRYSKIKNVSMLGNVHTLNLHKCHNITDVPMLGNVHTLILRWCNNIRDVSMLGNVHTLELSECRNITDVSMLGNVHTLSLYNCDYITDISMLGNVINLYLDGCYDIPIYQIEELKKTVKNLKY